MARIQHFECGRAADAERLPGLRTESVAPLSRAQPWRHALPHAKPLAALVWVARGQGRITVEARTRGYGPATLTLLPPRTPFALLPGAVTEGMVVVLPALVDAPFRKEPTRMRLSDVGVQAELGALLEHLARPGDLREPVNGRAALARVILLSALVEREARHAVPIRVDEDAARLAARFAHAAERALLDVVDDEAIALRLGVTPDHLDSVLTETCGCTTRRYRHDRAMHEAGRRLADTGDGPQAIADALGLASAAQFARAFGEAAVARPAEVRDAPRRATTTTRRDDPPRRERSAARMDVARRPSQVDFQR